MWPGIVIAMAKKKPQPEKEPEPEPDGDDRVRVKIVTPEDALRALVIRRLDPQKSPEPGGK